MVYPRLLNDMRITPEKWSSNGRFSLPPLRRKGEATAKNDAICAETKLSNGKFTNKRTTHKKL